ncbi:E3 ubiquitin-protein ligase rnf213-alpha-like [Mercenaria mercenaria]|uniref:E3 ubiquitin-protein ligase rnf213-alpha-like n=1 Tax=Mercenaria mercenaria TaxID=6596 RepID=UPI00234E7514|nr:E3 ubiquitin-protein ligase rnf213-alpha-like [Mercenaria mercenaria]
MDLISKTQRDILYPPSPHSTDISKWDIALLSFVILENFKPSFTASDISSVVKLRDMQDIVSAHQADTAIDGRKFTTIWSDLSLTITKLCHALNLNDDEMDYLNLVSSIASDGLDMNEAVKELEMLKDSGEFLKGIQTSLENLEYLESAKQSQTALETSVSALNEDDPGHLTEKMDRVQLTDTDESKDVIDDDATGTAVKDSNTSNSDTDTESTKMGDEKEIAENAVPELLAIKGKKKKRKKNKRKHKKDTDAKRQKLQTETDKDIEIVNKQGRCVWEDGFELSKTTTSNADKSLNPEQYSGMVFGMGKSTKTRHSENPPEMRATHQCSLFEGNIKNDKSLETKSDDDKNRSSKNQEKQAQTGVHSEAQTLDKLNNDAKYTASQATESDKDGTDVDGDYKTKMETRSKTKTPAERPNSKTRGKDPKRTPDESKRTLDRISTDTEEMIRVQFHVLISPDFNFDSNIDNVVIRLKTSDDRPPYRHHMEFVRELTSGYTEMTYTYDVPQNRVTGDSRLYYKYFVVKSAQHKQGKAAKNGQWEHYFVKGRTGASFDRKLHVPRERIDSKKSTIWHQFDGVANRKSDKGIFLSLINDHVFRNQKLQDDSKLAMQVFGEQIIQPVLSADLSASVAVLNIGEMTESLIHGLQKTYVNDGECFKSEYEMKKELGKYLFEPVLNVYTRLPERQTQETDKQWKRRLIVQLTLLTIWKEMKSDISMSTSQQLCKSFLIANSSDKKTCKEFEFIKQTFPTKIEFFKEALVTLGKLTTEQSKDPSWLYTMPLIHFLSGACNQLNENTRHDDTLPKWWGTMNRVQDTIANFKAHQHKRWEIPLLEVIQTLQPLFVVDFLLPRTIMACLNVSEVFDAISTGMIPVEICCATLVYFLKTKGSSGWLGGDGEGDVISKCMQTLVEQLTQGDNGSSNRELVQSWFLPTKISLDLVLQALRIKRNDTASNSIRVFLICTSNYVRLKEHRPMDQYSRQKVMKDFETVYQKTRMWLNDNYSHWYTSLRESIMVWNECMVPGDMILQELEELWNISLSDDLAGKLTSFIHCRRDNTEKVVKLYCKTVDSYNPFMQNCLHETAVKAIDGAYNIDVGHFDQNQRGRYGTLLSTMFHAEWSKIMQNVSDVNDRNFLKQILEWSPFLRFMKILVLQKQSHLLDTECEGNLMVTIAIVQSLVESLLKGSLTIGDLQIMHEYAETFADIASLVKMDDERNEITKEMILTGIKIRKKELDMFLSRAELIASLAFLCTPLTRVEMSTFDEVLIKQATIENHTLNEFCQPVKIDCVENIDDDFLPELIVFRLPASIDAILQKMHLCRKSSVFFKMWKTQCEKCDKDCTSLDDILKVWTPVYKRLEKVLREIESGKILFCQFEDLLGSNCEEDYEQIENELRILQIKQDIIETRVEQLKKYRYLETCKSGAESLLRLKSECNLEGDFEQIELIADDARENIEMEQFDDSLMDACEFLKDFSRSRASCLNTFLNCQPLVQWLKESMHTSGLKELQVFVDLASMSIGDDPYNIGKVQALHSAVTGYAPLIFDLREDCGFKELLDLCKLVWRELKANPKLPKQLEDTNSQIEWLTEIKNAHGVVEVQKGIDYLLFNLLILGCLMDKTGYVWRKLETDLYLIETMPIMTPVAEKQELGYHCIHPMLAFLPDITCRSPQESLEIYKGEMLQDHKETDQLFDEDEYLSEKYQRPFQYLLRLTKKTSLENVHPDRPEGNQQMCLEILLRYCGIQDPSWSELHHFVWFLNTQLVDFKENDFVSRAAADILPGFSTFVLRFLIQMSKDFSTRSLYISEESPGLRHCPQVMETDDEETDDIVQLYQMRRTWESSPHPYLFFNWDRLTFTFLGFNIQKASGNLIDQQTGNVLEESIMQSNLYEALERNHVPLQEHFNLIPREEKIKKLRGVMGKPSSEDPDNTYELTTDNVKKILAIYMRFRCDIPVIIMGETGCGKTRLVKFLCGLQIPKGENITNMVLMKVHGGTTSKDIIKKVRKAEALAESNMEKYGKHMYTVLFFDEANSTQAIGLIKEIMCDKSMEGEKLQICVNLKIVAACNPYRKHTEELIKKLEQAGLGYHVDADETIDRLGRVPMRRLVYRVQPLPQSLLPLVWDFGQLNTQVEDLYIQQMVKRHIVAEELPDITGLKEAISAILTASQDYMRQQKDECSFVSLRDVERVLTVMSWFYKQSQNERLLYNLMDEKLNIQVDTDEDSDTDDDIIEEETDVQTPHRVDDITRSLILALGVCYHACLKTREQYRDNIASYFQQPCKLPGGSQQIFNEIDCCQDVFLDQVDLAKNIARNMALKENVFMMVVCIELRIPLFLIGKPGSSKSLAKTIVSDAMRGNAAKRELFRGMKQAQMASFQCSPLSTPDGIVGTFKQCARFQRDKNLDTFVSVVVLDEVGLAEDSPRMPLKTLHPLLEDGCHGEEKPDEYEEDLNADTEDEEHEQYQMALHPRPEDDLLQEDKPEKYKKVAFIGISNWALDPAKMNRGIVVQREVPDIEELINSARGICSTDEEILSQMEHLIQPMAVSYLELFNTASEKTREFFGLRDFYSLVKMVFSFVEQSKKAPTWHQMLHAIKRNFEGLDQVDPVESFKKHLSKVLHVDSRPRQDDPDCSAAGLIRACLFDTNNLQSESRYMLLLTENYGALAIIQQLIFGGSDVIRPITIFGSSFRSDQEYTQVCLNINKIKVCMETGNTVVLLNLENLYESLYDALNQYYVFFGDVRYVDLGLGTHRVKCPVHPDFRLIVIAEKDTVYKKFPIPLINRLEKHFLTINTMLTEKQRLLASKLEQWARDFSSQNQSFRMNREQTKETKVGDVFIGFHEDSCSAIILYVWQKYSTGQELCEEKLFQEAKFVLLWCATPDAIVRLKKSSLPVSEQEMLFRNYFNEQAHSSIVEYISYMLLHPNTKQFYSQVTTHSKLLTSVHIDAIGLASGIDADKILLLETLSSFDTEQQFTTKIRQHMKITGDSAKLIVIQCDSGDVNANLIACARYCVMDEFEKLRDEMTEPVHVVLIVQLPKVSGGCFTGFQCGKWHSAHIDDLQPEDMHIPSLEEMHGKSVGMLIDDAVTSQTEPMETDDSSSTGEAMEWKNNTDTCTRNFLNSGQEDLKLDDVLSEFENVGNNVKRRMELYKNKLDVKKLVLSCVQSALSMVKDKAERSNRETERVDFVIRLLHQDPVEGQSSFLQGICVLIARLLQQKERKVGTAYNATHWLVNEAATLENTSKTGTFRSSCIKVLESKVSPILAGIIAYCDTNGNLSILQETQYPWKQQLWLEILNTPGIINLQYKEFQSPIKLNDLNEVTVFSSGCEGRAFYARMPFSWLFIDKICEVLNLDRTSREKLDPWEARNVRIEACRRVLSEHPLFKFYEDIRNERIILEGIREYTCDLIRTLYPAGPNEEFDVVFDSITAMTETLQYDMPASSLLNSVIYIHLAFEALSSRLNSFHMLNVAWPECSEAIIKLKAENPDHFLFKENEITFTGVYLLIESIAPGKDTLESGGGRSEWLGKVHRYRSVVEKVISLYSEDPTLYGANVAQIVRKIKMLWSRVTVMKLFIEHVCVSDEENRTSVKHYTSLWSLLGDEADMKTKGSFIAVEKFLKACNKKVMKDCFRSVDKCSDCEKVLEGAPITLPCQHVLCDRCYNDLRAAQTNKCAKCRKKIVDGWVPGNTDENGSEERLKDYQKRCNAFFMDVISQLSFADKTAPSDEVVEKLLSYAFCRTRGNRQYTKDLSIFNTGIDPNPVLRSFLLQLLLKTSEQQVLNSLRRYLDEMKALFDKDTMDRDDIYLLVIHCLEDKLLQAACADDAGLDGYALKTLQSAAKSLEKEDLIENLYGLASARMGLAVVADCIAKIVRQDLVQSSIETLLETAKHLCEKTKSGWPRTYLVKYLCRCYGIDVYQAACSSQVFDLRWIAIMDMNEVVSDRYIICGEVYTELREAVSSALLEGNIDILQRSILKCEGNDVRAEIMLQLAIYRVVTVSHLSPQVQRKFTPEMLLTLSEFIKESDTLKHKELSLRLIENRMIPNGLVSVEGEDLRLQGIKSLIVHFHTVLTQLKGERTLLQPLISLIEEPQNCTDFFLPTMPQDELEDVKEALRAQQAIVKGSEKLMFYRCPNKHAYVIGDCGRPYVKSKCHCGAEIGGEGHKLLDTNTADTATDQTMTGHILGAADARGPGPKAERLMTPAACATVRLLIHMAMYLGVGSDTKGIQELIKPDIETDQVEEFLWRHIQLDVNDIQRAITRSVDDVLLFMHCIINGITKNHDSENIVQEDLYLLSSKRGRQEWEAAFVSRFLKCHFLNMDDILHESNHKIVNDERLGADPLLCLLYETDNQMMSPSALQDSPRVWRYRTPVSLQHLRQRLEAETGSAEIPQSKFKILQHFLAEEYHLRALRCVPSILRLQRLLLQKYHKKIDKAEASHITVAQLKKDDVSGSDIAQLIADLSEAWELSRNELRFYSCTTEAGYATIPDGFCEHGINDDTPLSMLLPTTGGVGLCSFALLDFLMRKQNDFLDKYIKETERNSDHISKVSPKEVTSAHLISYDALHDLLPLILANCKYTFKMGEGTSIEYDFAGLERHLMDRFLFSKSKIDVGVILPINRMVYRTESTNAEVFKMLAEYIEQESLNASVKTQICEELRSLPDICQSLYDLDITISFLKTTGGLPNQNLHEYMRNTLQMERTVASQKAQQMCRLKHVQSLWMLLAFQKSKTMIDNQQQREYAFESVQHVFDVDLTNDHLENFNHYMKDLSVDKLSLLVEVLHELILLKVAVEQNTDDPDYTDIAGKQMKDWLLAYIDEKEDHPLDTAILLEFPEDIKLEHSVHTWVVAYRMLKGKQTGAYSKY